MAMLPACRLPSRSSSPRTRRCPHTTRPPESTVVSPGEPTMASPGTTMSSRPAAGSREPLERHLIQRRQEDAATRDRVIARGRADLLQVEAGAGQGRPGRSGRRPTPPEGTRRTAPPATLPGRAAPRDGRCPERRMRAVRRFVDLHAAARRCPRRRARPRRGTSPLDDVRGSSGDETGDRAGGLRRS